MSPKSQTVFVRGLFLSLALMAFVAAAAIFADSEGPYRLVGSLPVSGLAGSDNFGSTITTSDQTAAVGAPGWRGNGTTDAGSVFIFKRDFLGWTQQVQIIDSDGRDNDRFGSAVALDGDILAIGAPFRDRSTPSTIIDAGAVTLYTGSNATRTKQQFLMPDDLLEDNLFGWSLDMDGETLIVGAPTHDLAGNEAAYIYRRNGTSWVLEDKLNKTDGPIEFGTAVSIRGDVALVGAPGPRYGDLTPLVPGEVHIYTRSGADWTAAGTLIPTESSTGDLFGCAIDYDGTTAVIAACQATYGDDPDGPGIAYVFIRSGSTWTQQARLRPAMGNERLNVSSVALQGDRLILGVENAPSENSNNPGAAFVYERSGTTWKTLQVLQPTDTGNYDAIGSAVAFTTDDLLIGAEYGHGDSGAVYIYNGGTGNGEHIYFPVILGRPAQPDKPGALDQIVYTVSGNSSSEIYSVHADGTGKINLTFSQEGTHSPAWSPDRRLIAFVGQLPSSAQQLMVMNADGSGARVIPTPNLDLLGGISWSADGTTLAFNAYTKYTVWDIYTIGLDGTRLINLTADLNGHTANPDWSRDGSRIAFNFGANNRINELWTMNADGSGKMKLDTELEYSYSPSWSPDSLYILFSGGPEGSLTNNLYTISATGGPSQLVLESASGGVWSPSGTEIVFTGEGGGIFRYIPRDQSILPVDPDPDAGAADW